MLFIIARAIALPVGIQIDTGDDLRLQIALREDDPHPLIIFCDTLERISGTGPRVHIAFCIIDLAIPHDLLYLSLGYLPALHPAFCMLRVFDIGHPAIESMVAI